MSEEKELLSSLMLHPLGLYHSNSRYKFEQPRQGCCEAGGEGCITLYEGFNYEQALEDLSGFERIWLIYHLHLNADTWRTKAAPPLSARSSLVLC